jgi:hypothetical protein
MNSTATRAIRIAAIVAAAQARAALGQAAQYERLPDGRHRVSIFDLAAGRLLIGVGVSVQEAIDDLRKEPSE